jgi:hypothetical protein
VKTVTTREATVKTLSIEAKVIKIGPKQVTLSVFRQLFREPLIDAKTLQLRGTPWGLVNYRWGECADRGQDHLHVVWQEGDFLRRDCLDSNPWLQLGISTHLHDLGDLSEALGALGFGEGCLDRKPAGIDCVPSPYGRHLSLEGWSLAPQSCRGWAFRLAQAVYQFWSYRYMDEPRKNFEEIVSSMMGYLDTRWPEYHARIDATALRASIGPLIRDAHRAADRYRADYLARHAELSQLDQLFIAV